MMIHAIAASEVGVRARSAVRAGLSVAALAVLAACGGSDGGGTAAGGPTVTGGVVKGPVLGATVCAYALTGGAKGAQLAVQATGSGSVSSGCYVTGADGAYSFQLPAGTTGDVLLESTGGRFCSDEAPVAGGACASGTLVDLGSGVMTSAATVATGSASVYVTPLTTAAVSTAGAQLSASSFTTRFQTLAGQILGAGTAVTPGTAPTSANQPFLAQAGAAMGSGGSLAGVLGALQQGSTTFPGGGANTPATVNAALVGTYQLTFRQGSGEGCGSVCSFTDGQAVTVTVYGDGRLSLAGKELSSPFHRSYGGSPHLPEAIWRDPAGTVEYALSDNELGVFNEINVGDAARPQGALGTPAFLGQLRKAVVKDTGADKLAPLAGSYQPVLFSKSGNFQGNSQPALDAAVAVAVSTAGVVTVDGFVFDPADSAVTFYDFVTLGNPMPAYYALSRKENDQSTLGVKLYMVEGAVVGWSLERTTQSGGGVFATNSWLLEERPLPAAQTALLAALKARGDIALKAVVDDAAFYSGYVKCEALVLAVTGDGSAATPWMYRLRKPGVQGAFDQDGFERSVGRYTEANGTQRIAFRRNRLVLHASGVVEVESFQGAVVKDRATSDTQEAAAACP